MSLDNFRVRKGLTVDGDSTIAGSETVNGSVIIKGATSGQVSLTAPAVAGSQAYTLPTALPAVNNYVLTSQTDGTMGWAAGSSVTTTYNIDATTVSGGANLNLNGSDASVDSVKFAGGTNITVTRTDANTITINGSDLNTTYTVDASATTGGANFNLVGSDATTDTIKLASGGATTVSQTNASTITISSTDTNTTYTQDASATTGGANLNLVGSDSTTDTIKFASGTGIAVSQTDASTITISNTSTGTTYDISSSAVTGGANLNLNGSNSTTDSVKFAGGTNVTVTSTDANTVTIAATDTNTTYSINASTTTGGANFNLVGSDSTTDTIKFQGAGATAVSRVNADTIEIFSTDNNTTYTLGSSVATGGANLVLYGSDLVNSSTLFNSGTGVTIGSTGGGTAIKINIGQDVGTSSTVTFNTVNANLTGNVTGTVSSLSNHTTTDLAEGTNLYYTDARSRAALSAGTGISYNSTTGVITSTITQYTDAMARAALSVTSSGDGSLAYNNTTGVFTYTGPSATNYRASLSGGTGVTYNSSTGVIAIGQAVATSSDVTFNSVSTATLKANDGTTALTLTNATGDVTTNRYLQVNGNRILNSAGTPTFYFDTSGNASVASNLTILGNILRAWNGSASVTTITMTATGDITVAGNVTVGGNIIKASDGTTAATLSASTGDITYNSRLLSSASKTIRTGPNRTTSYASVSGATAEDILIAGIGSAGQPISGLLVTNSGLPTASTSGRRQGILVRDYGGLEYNGVAGTTAPQGYFMAESSRGTAAEPRALNINQPLAVFAGFSNAGSDLASGNTPYWTAENYPTNPAFGLVSTQNHRAPYGSGSASSVFIGTISGTTLTVSSVTLGTILIGQEMKLGSGAAWPITTNPIQIIAQTSGTTGGIGTYTLNTSPGTYSSATAFYGTNTTLGTQFFMNVQPQNTPITSSSRVQQAFSADGIILRAQSANPSTNIFQVNSWPTTVLAGTGTGTSAGNFVQGTNKTYLGISDTDSTFTNRITVAGQIRTSVSALQLQDSTGVSLVGNNLTYNRVYGQWQWDATVTPAAANTAYAFPIQGASGTTDYANIASVANTSQIIPGALGMYKLQFSVQVNNADNGSEHTAYFWWRKNGTDITGSMGRITVPKGGSTIGGWDNMVQVTSLTDYYELYYAVDDTNLTFPFYASTAFGPSTAAIFFTLVPVGA